MGLQPTDPKLDFRALFEHVPGLYLVLAVDPQYTILAASDAYLEATMTHRGQIIGRPGFDIFPNNPSQPHDGEMQMRASFERVLRTREPDAVGVIKYDIRRPESDGGGFEERYWRALNAPLLDGQGEVTAIVHRAEDVTELLRMRGDSARNLLAAEVLRESEARLRALAKELNAARELADEQRRQAEAANRAKDQFLAMLSHELRTPLTPVLLTVSLLERFENLPGEVQDDIQTIRRNVELEARLIDDLLDLTRITRGTLQLHFETVDAHTLLRDAVNLCCHERLGDLSLHFEAERHHVRADPARLQQIFWNVLSNADKFTPIGEQITITTRNADGDRLVVEVADQGVGIDATVLPAVFNAFQQGDASLTRNFGGLGLGLTITRQLIEAHHGTIEAHSAGRMKGSTFTIDLPTVLSSGTNEVKPDKAPPPSQAPMRILLVEDHVGTLTAMTKLLSGLGHHVITAATVKEAFAAAEHEPIDLVISDLGLPDGSGHDLMRALRSRYAVKGIAVSGFGMDEDISRSAESGYEKHLTKPVDLERLQAAIQQTTK
jgi:signal transduction histidine kinase